MLVSCLFLVTAVLAGTSVFAADPVGTWDVVARTNVTVCVRGRCQSQSADSQGVLVISAEGTYTAPSDVAGCDVSDEQGTWFPLRRGRYRLKPSNAKQLVNEMKSCLGAGGLTLRGRFRNVFKPNDDGTTANGRVRFNGSGSFRGIAFTATATQRYTATRIHMSARTDVFEVRNGGLAGFVALIERAVP